MKRTPLVRKTPLRAKLPGARLTITLKKVVCKGCKVKFMQDRFNQSVCGGACALVVTEAKNVKVQRLAEKKQRALDAEARLLSTPVKLLLPKVEKVINAYVRERDRYEGCISCDKPASWDGVWHASHFKSVGSNSILRFHLWNIHKSCLPCNYFKSGNIVEYEKRLVAKKGRAVVEWLKCQNGVKKYEASYLLRLKKVIALRTKRLVASRRTAP